MYITRFYARRFSRHMPIRKPIRGVLLDITGVLYNSRPDGGGVPIAGSIDAFNRLQASNLPVRLCSNETQNLVPQLTAKLQRIGYTELNESQVFTPAPVAANLLRERGLRPYLLVHSRLMPSFAGIDQTNPNCVVVGDAGEEFTYDNLNKAFQLLVSSPKPQLLALGVGKYYMETDGLKIDVGAYTHALEYACDLKAEIVGKPSKAFFQLVLDNMGIKADEAVMIGDDIVSDVQGALDCGMQAILVRTGKWRSQWENHPTIQPSAIADDLATATELLLANAE